MPEFFSLHGNHVLLDDGDLVNWKESLDIVIRETGHHRYRWLCSEENPDTRQREKYRALVVRKATGEPEPAPEQSAALRAYLARHGCGGC